MTTNVLRMLALAVFLAAASVTAAEDPLALVSPCVSISAADRQALARGEIVGRALPAHHGQVAVFAATRIAASGEALAEATRRIADLKKSSFVFAIRRFSDPPQLSDLDELVPGPRDLAALQQCEIGKCSFKLTAQEIAALQPHRGDPQALVRAFRRVVFDRVTAYLDGGLAALPPIANRSHSKSLSDTLAALQAESPCVLQRRPLQSWVRDFPAGGGVESFLYWSYETYGSGKPVVLVTHVAIHRDSPGTVIVVGKQILATRYLDGALAMTAIVAGAGGSNYLVYLNRSSVDLLGGLFGPVKRSVLESRLAGEVPEIIMKLRTRLERNSHDTRPDSLRHD